MSARHLYARMATMDIIPMRVRRMGTTDRDGSRAVSSSAPVRGITAITVRGGDIGRAGATTGADGMAIRVAGATDPVHPDTHVAVEPVPGATPIPQRAVASTVRAAADVAKPRWIG